MLANSAKTAFSAFALLLLAGCTFTLKTGSDADPKQAQKPAGNTAAAKPASTAKPAQTQPAADLAPRISAPTVFGNGTGGAFRGHAYVIPESTTKMPDLGSMIPFATLFTDNFNIRAATFSGGFPGALIQEEWFAIRYEGNFSVPTNATWQFKLESDDGAILYIDGKKVIDNDGLHTAKTAAGQTELKAGTHALRLDYFQAKKGSAALVLNIVQDGKDQILSGQK